jgi:hypothetical protein
MFMVEADHFYDEYELSNHELLELRGRLAMQLAEMREQYGDLLPSPAAAVASTMSGRSSAFRNV